MNRRFMIMIFAVVILLLVFISQPRQDDCARAGNARWP